MKEDEGGGCRRYVDGLGVKESESICFLFYFTQEVVIYTRVHVVHGKPILIPR